jgi:hypothetical protein
MCTDSEGEIGGIRTCGRRGRRPSIAITRMQCPLNMNIMRIVRGEAAFSGGRGGQHQAADEVTSVAFVPAAGEAAGPPWQSRECNVL